MFVAHVLKNRSDESFAQNFQVKGQFDYLKIPELLNNYGFFDVVYRPFHDALKF